MATWPPTLAQLKEDMKADLADTRYDVPLQVVLDAAVAYVQRVRTDVDFLAAGDPPAEADDTKTAAVTADLVLGTLRYARRLDYRRESPGGAIIADQLGSVPVAGWDADIEKLLRVGRYGRVRFA